MSRRDVLRSRPAVDWTDGAVLVGAALMTGLALVSTGAALVVGGLALVGLGALLGKR